MVEHNRNLLSSGAVGRYLIGESDWSILSGDDGPCESTGSSWSTSEAWHNHSNCRAANRKEKRQVAGGEMKESGDGKFLHGDLSFLHTFCIHIVICSLWASVRMRN